MPPEQAASIVKALGIDAARPLVTQVSRFDAWKDPWGVIDAYRLARQSHPGFAVGPPRFEPGQRRPRRGEQVLNSVREYAAGDPDVHLFFSPEGLPAANDEIVNALQTHSHGRSSKIHPRGFRA